MTFTIYALSNAYALSVLVEKPFSETTLSHVAPPPGPMGGFMDPGESWKRSGDDEDEATIYVPLTKVVLTKDALLYQVQEELGNLPDGKPWNTPPIARVESHGIVEDALLKHDVARVEGGFLVRRIDCHTPASLVGAHGEDPKCPHEVATVKVFGFGSAEKVLEYLRKAIPDVGA